MSKYVRKYNPRPLVKKSDSGSEHPFGLGAAVATSIANGNYQDNSAVASCILAIYEAFILATPAVKRNGEILPSHPLSDLAQTLPWEFVLTSLIAKGYSYVLRGMDDIGIDRAWLALPPQTITPIERGYGNIQTPPDFYQVNINGRTLTVPLSRLLHFKKGANFAKPWQGRSPLESLASEIALDSYINAYISTYAKNYGMAAFIAMPSADYQDTSFSDEVKDSLERSLNSYTGTSGNAGKGKVSKSRFDITTLASGDLRIRWDDITQIPESRIAAVLQVPPNFAGLLVGLKHTTNRAQAATELRYFMGTTVQSYWNLIAKFINEQAADWLGPGEEFLFDTSGIEALQESEDEKIDRLLKLRGILTDAQIAAELGYEYIEREQLELTPTEPRCRHQ